MDPLGTNTAPALIKGFPCFKFNPQSGVTVCLAAWAASCENNDEGRQQKAGPIIMAFNQLF